jgi:hypothetical protein
MAAKAAAHIQDKIGRLAPKIISQQSAEALGVRLPSR